MYGLLIAEDELIERTVLRKTLEKRFGDQCNFFEAQNGKEAIGLFENERIDIAILDIGMPVVDGIQVAETIRKKNQECCIIFLTAYDRFDYAKKAISVGAMEYILKPYSRQEVISVVEEAVWTIGKYERWHSFVHTDGEGFVDKPPRFFEVDDQIESSDSDDESMTRLSVMGNMVEEYIHSHYMDRISMQDAARAINYSEPYFCKMFKLQFGQSFTSYLSNYRINEAKKLLCQPNVNVKDVGIRVGYPDSNYFTKVFRRLTKMNPSDYRMSMLQKL